MSTESKERITVYTIGHANHELDAFLALLGRHAIGAVADVRTSPYSARFAHFNREPLSSALSRCGVDYAFFGDRLGGRPRDAGCYDRGQVRYDRVARTKLFAEGIEQLLTLARRRATALLCAEKDPLSCHRTLLVGRRLHEAGVAVMHILGDGGLETQTAAEDRLLDDLGLPHGDLFQSRAEFVEQAYERQSHRVAFALSEAERAAQEAMP